MRSPYARDLALYGHFHASLSLSCDGSSSRSQALPGNACREAPPPLLGTGALTNKDNLRMKMSFFLKCSGSPSGDRRSSLRKGPVARPH